MNRVKTITMTMTMTGLVFLAAACNRFETNYLYSDGTVELTGRVINIQLADELAEQTRGLAGRQSIKDDEGMLFLFNRPEIASFWMKGMLFPIDIIWIRDNKVADISPSIQPEPDVPDIQLRTYQPKLSIDAVLEVKAGWTGKNGIKVGDRVDFNQVKK